MIRVLHFARVINRHDFIDHVIRFANADRFTLMACTLQPDSDSEPPNYAADGFRHFVIEGRQRKTYPVVVLKLARLLRRERVDILHTHHYDEAVIGVLAAKLAKTRAIILGRHYHDELYLVASGIKLRTLLAVEGFCNRSAARIVVPSHGIRRLLIERQGVPADKVEVVPYGFDFMASRYRAPDDAERGAIRREMRLEGYYVVGNFSRHYSLKGQRHLLSAFGKLARDFPRARLLMVGDGPDSSALRVLARELSVAERIVFAGWRRDALRLMAAVDVVVEPSLVDSFPQVTVEALSMGRPLITTMTAGPLDQIRNGETGVLVPIRDPDALCSALRWVAEHPGEARQLGERGREYVLRELDIRKGIHRYETVYTDVLRGVAA